MPTYSTGYQFKLIGTGEEAGTWGASTNRNLQKIEAAIGRAVEVNVVLPGGTSSWSDPTLTWTTDETAATGVSGSEGRCSYVVFTNSLAVSALVAVKIRGNSASDLPGRTFIVKNGLDSPAVIDLSIGSSTYSLRNGCTVQVFTSVDDIDGSGANAVVNALGFLQLEGLDLQDSASAKIYIQASQANALSVNDGTSDHLTLDTANSKLILKGGTTQATVEVTGTDKDLELKSGAGNSNVILSPQGTGTVNLTSGQFVGNLTGDITGNLGGAADQVRFETASGVQSAGVVLGPIGGGVGFAKVDSSFSYLPAAQVLSVPTVICGSLVGDSAGLTVESGGAATTLTVESPILVNPTIGANDFALANHTHADASTGGPIDATARGAGSITNVTMPLTNITSIGPGEQQTASSVEGDYAFGSIGKAFETVHNVTSPTAAHAFLRYKGPGTPSTGIPNIGGYGWSVGDRLPILSTNSIGMFEYNVLLSDTAGCSWGWNATHVWLTLGPCWGTGLLLNWPTPGAGGSEAVYAADGTGAQRFFATMSKIGNPNPTHLTDPVNPTGIELRIRQCADWEVVISVVG
jgi:hypothetical protein